MIAIDPEKVERIVSELNDDERVAIAVPFIWQAEDVSRTPTPVLRSLERLGLTERTGRLHFKTPLGCAVTDALTTKAGSR